jgi:DNA-binding beta-propeller fold protein YncE
MRYPTKQLLILIAIAFLVLSSATGKAQAVKGAFLYTLSNFTGPLPYNWAKVSVDGKRSETYVLYQNNIRVFNENGMEIYRFGDDLELGHIVDVAINEEGDILLLSYEISGTELKYSITRCNFRGEPKSKIEMKNLPEEFSKFSPGRMVYHNGDLYLASLMGMKVVVTDSEGNFKDGYDDIEALAQIDEKEKGNVEMVGFSVDKEGNILFTIPSLFKAYKLSLDRKVTSFGRPGGAPGRFGIIAGIVSDEEGNYLVVDKLKCTVMVFDKNQNFLTEFGNRGFKPGNLIAPDDIAIDQNGRIYVTQSRRRGVSVFKIIYN